MVLFAYGHRLPIERMDQEFKTKTGWRASLFIDFNMARSRIIPLFSCNFILGLTVFLFEKEGHNGMG